MMLRNILSKLSLIAVLFSVSSAQADDKVKGHITPLPSETLSQPIKLTKCGDVTIHEWRGNGPDKRKLKKLNDACEIAINKFEEFIKYKGLEIKRTDRDFDWKVSIIPDNHAYRNLNDSTYRFVYRGHQHIEFWGYTSLTNHYIFLADEATMEFWVHEIFHALSMTHGVFDAHHPWYKSVRVETDEKLAKEFTVWLGLGKT